MKEPKESVPVDTARKLEDLTGHCAPCLHWSGDVHDDDHCYTQHKRQGITPRPTTLNVFLPDDPSDAAAAHRIPLGPRKYDRFDATARERRERAAVLTPIPGVATRLKPAAGYWGWQQREIGFNNQLIRKYVHNPTSPRKEHPCPASAQAPEGGLPLVHSSTADRPVTPVQAPQLHHSPRHHSASSPRVPSVSPRRHEVKQKIMELAAKFGV